MLNAAPEARQFQADQLAGLTMALHPVQAHGVDAVVKTAAFESATGTFTVPARTAAVFVEPNADVVETPDTIEELILAVVELEVAGVLRHGQARPLVVTLVTARIHLLFGHYDLAADRIERFIARVEDLLADGDLSEAQARPLLDGAALVLAALEDM